MSRIDTHVDEHVVWVAALSCYTGIDLHSQTSGTAHAICNVCLSLVGGWLAEEQLVQEVIDKEHLSGRISLCAVDVAVERGICYVVSGLPDIGEFYTQLLLVIFEIVYKKNMLTVNEIVYAVEIR